MNQEFPLASRTKRIIAFLIDHFIICVLFIPILFLIFDFETISAVEISYFLIIIFMIYPMKDSYKGISIGKWIMGIMVRDQNDPDRTPSFFRLYARNLFVLISLIEFIVLVLNPKKQRIGDILCKTIVVPNPLKAPKSHRVLALVGVFICLGFFGAYSGAVMIKTSPAYKIAEQEISQDEAIISRIGEIQRFGFLPQGNISISNGHGKASFTIKVKGENDDLWVQAILEKQPKSDWELIGIKY